MHAWIADAAFWCGFALFAIRSAWAHTEIVFEQINALGIVLALIDRTEFDFFLAIIAGPAFFANALIRTGPIDTFAIHARLVFAVIDVRFTCSACITSSAFARKLIVQINATFRSDWVAWVAQALVDFGFALKTDEAWTALADKAVDFVNAGAGILTRN